MLKCVYKAAPGDFRKFGWPPCHGLYRRKEQGWEVRGRGLRQHVAVVLIVVVVVNTIS
jgi:hypothetical protein